MSYRAARIRDLLRGASVLLRRSLAGTSGPLYAVLLLRAAVALKENATVDTLEWAAAFSMRVLPVLPNSEAWALAIEPCLMPYYPQQRPFALRPSRQFPRHEALHAAAAAARLGADATAAMYPRRGRSSYLGERAIGIKDPGAEAVARWLDALANSWEVPVPI